VFKRVRTVLVRPDRRVATRHCTATLTLTLLALLGQAALGMCASPATKETTTPDGTVTSPTPELVLAALQRTLTWYESARAAVQSTEGILDADFARGEQQTAQRVLQGAFDTARARAALVGRDGRADSPETPSRQSRVDRVAQLEASIGQEERGITELRTRLRTATPATRPDLERQLAAANNHLELGRVRLDFVKKLVQVDSAASDADGDLSDQIKALQDTVPELRPATPTTVVTTSPPPAVWPSGARALIYRLFALQRSRRTLKELTRTTSELAQATQTELHDAQDAVRPMAARLEVLATTPAPDGASLAAGQTEFRDLLKRTTQFRTVVLSLREESALLHRYGSGLQAWRKALDRELEHVLRGFALELVGVGIALAAILLASVLWRAAVARYVTGDYQQRLLLAARRIVVVLAIALVLVFHFASELTALVAALGFAAAGIAFALQNVILAVAGYFSMMAPNGIRAGDRVSLQGPFGYVHGEVIEIGVVRTRLRELAGDPLEPTGGTMVFPNSVAFTGSFIKHPPQQERRH
jgi:Mechanosensitive ion channel